MGATAQQEERGELRISMLHQRLSRWNVARDDSRFHATNFPFPGLHHAEQLRAI